MKNICITLAFVLAAFSAEDVFAAKCVGAANCKVCTNCTRCEYCKGGRTCGVCGIGSKPEPFIPSPPNRPIPPSRISPPPPTKSPFRSTELGPSDIRPDSPSETPETARATTPAAVQDGISIYFSPKGGCTDAIVGQIDRANTSVKVQAYRLTSIPIVKALVAAHTRGVKVSIILDKMQQSEKYSDATYFHNKGMAVLIDPKHAIAHNKVILIDERVIITGSFNFSANAEDSNAENLLVIEDKKELMAAYLKNFTEHAGHSVPYKGIETAAVGSATELDERTLADCKDWMQLASLYIKAKNFSAARETLNKIVSKGGDSDYAKQAKKMLESLEDSGCGATATPGCCNDADERSVAERWISGSIEIVRKASL